MTLGDNCHNRCLISATWNRVSECCNSKEFSPVTARLFVFSCFSPTGKVQRRRRCFVYPQSRKPEAEVIFVCFDVVRRLGCQLSPDGWSRPHQRWREVIRHHFGISPAMQGDGGRGHQKPGRWGSCSGLLGESCSLACDRHTALFLTSS